MGTSNGASFVVLLLVLWAHPSSSSCDAGAFLSQRRQWASGDEPCHQKLSFDLWLSMKAQEMGAGSEPDEVLTSCLRSDVPDMVQLSVEEDWAYKSPHQDHGEVVYKRSKAAAFKSPTYMDLEAICDDAGVMKAMPIAGSTGRLRGPGSGRGQTREGSSTHSRRLQSTVSEAVAAHEVAELIAGLEALGCANTRGEGQTLCVISDSFNVLGTADSLQESGDLPEVEAVLDSVASGSDEGSAMIELAYDIAPGASYKFHTAYYGEDAMAETILELAYDEDCDVTVDDWHYYVEPAYRDGVIAQAVNEVVMDLGTLHFESADNRGLGWTFMSAFECTSVFGDSLTTPLCDSGAATHVFDDMLPESDPFRYLALYQPSFYGGRLFIKWDEDIDEARDLVVSVWELDGDNLELIGIFTNMADGRATVRTSEYDVDEVYVAIHQDDETPADYSAVDFLMTSSSGTIDGAEDRSMWGSACATNSFSTAAIFQGFASGEDGQFEDPETSSVESFSSRGPCFVRSDAGGDLEERLKPVTTAADGLSTSTPGFYTFYGTSAAAPVAAAIATLVRAACAPERVLTRDDFMEILTDYEYIIDYTSDADGALETFGVEAGYGIISASQMLAWVEQNCASACPGGASPTPMPSTSPQTSAPTTAPTPAPTKSPEGPSKVVEVAKKTRVKVAANGYDERPGEDEGDVGCGTEGCLPELTRDNDWTSDESRWSCQRGVVPDHEDCEIEFSFRDAQDVVRVEVAFYKPEERTRELQVLADGQAMGSFESDPDSEFTIFELDADGVQSISLKVVDLNDDDWLSLLEVLIYVDE